MNAVDAVDAVDAAGGRATSPDKTTPALAVDRLSKSFAGNRVLSEVSFEIRPGEIHALLGQNGSGKSTLIKVLAGYHLPDQEGTVAVGGQHLKFGSPTAATSLGCRFVHQDLGLVLSNSILENYFMAGSYPRRFATLKRKAAEAEVSAVLQTMGITVGPNASVASLSAAERSLLAISRALRGTELVQCKVLVLDEPTASLPPHDVNLLLQRIRVIADNGVGILYVTHHLNEVFRIADRVTVLRDGLRVATERVTELSEDSLVRYLVGGEIKKITRPGGSSHTASPSAPSLTVDSISGGVLQSLSFDAYPGEVLGLAGLTGSGRDVVLGAIFGATLRLSGRVILRGREVPALRPDIAVEAGAGFISADRKLSGIMSFTAAENLTLPDLGPFWRGLRLHAHEERAECREWFNRLNVRPSGAESALLSTFSGGNQQKILLAKWLRYGQPVLLLDDPTQGVDVQAKAEIHSLILAAAEGGTAVVLSSSDVDELATVCDRVIVLYRGLISAELIGKDITATDMDVTMLTGKLPTAEPQ